MPYVFVSERALVQNLSYWHETVFDLLEEGPQLRPGGAHSTWMASHEEQRIRFEIEAKGRRVKNAVRMRNFPASGANLPSKL